MELRFNENLIQQNDSLIVAVSGGVDSMVLLSYLLDIKKKKNLRLSVVHMNYHRRPTSKQDERLVLEYCIEHFVSAKIFDYAPGSEENFQADAREARYRVFAEYAQKLGASKIALAHHADDQIETVMMRLTRGSSLKGYSGIQEMSKYGDLTLIRPLLSCAKEDIENYAMEHHIPFAKDESNDRDDYTRNRFRHHVIPFLKSENPKILDKINSFVEDIASAARLVQTNAEIFLNTYANPEGEDWMIPIPNFLSLEVVVRKQVLMILSDRVAGNLVEMTDEHMYAVMNLCVSSHPNLELKIAKTLVFYREYQWLRVRKETYSKKPFSFELSSFGTVTLPNNDKVIISEFGRNNGGNQVELWYNNIDFQFPIIIRSRLDKDTLSYAFGHRKLKDVLIDRKMPMQQRDELPIVCDGTGEIIHVPGIYTRDKRDEDNLRLFINTTKG
ncbi:MAG: tRNA lysidine(34) synthetase TilS [Candidatus Izemoplasmatales bacterium]|nr:tRNA lysidine(34) synthetase TilS [Candidatus Izemoplasmatales bacterium]